MTVKSVEKRRIIDTEDILDLARSRTDRPEDLGATYESYSSVREMGMTPEPLAEAGDLEAARPAKRVIERQEDRVIFDPLKPMIRKAPPVRFVSSTEFPTEWTLDQ